MVNGMVINEVSKIKDEIERYITDISGESKGKMIYTFDNDSLEISGDVGSLRYGKAKYC